MWTFLGSNSYSVCVLTNMHLEVEAPRCVCGGGGGGGTHNREGNIEFSSVEGWRAQDGCLNFHTAHEFCIERMTEKGFISESMP